MSEDFSTESNIISVSLFKNHFTGDSSYFARITRNTVSSNNLIARIQRKNVGIDPYMMQHVIGLLKNEIITVLSEGKAVNMMDLGTFYLSPKGKIDGSNPGVTEIPEFTVRFTPSQETSDAVKSIHVDKIVIASNAPLFNTITDLYSGKSDMTLTAGKSCRISGQRLKVTGEGCGISFAPFDGDGNVSKDESSWLKVTKLYKNMPGTLEFYLPPGLEAGAKYSMVVRTKYSRTPEGVLEPVENYSEQVTITKE